MGRKVMNLDNSYKPVDNAIESVRVLNYSAGSHEPVHAHQQGQLIFPLHGMAQLYTDNHIWVLVPGCAIWVPSGTTHELRAVGDVVTQNLYLSAQHSRAFGKQLRCLTVTPLLQALIQAAQETPHLDARLSLIQPLLLDELQRLPEQQPCHIQLPKDRRARLLCDALSRDLACAETLAWWGLQVGASERTLARLFREETQLSFSEWRQHMRLVEGVCRLAKGMAINRLSVELGYRSPSAFIAMFRKKMGVSPQRYLQRLS